ncbi:MAG: RelA/SpoT domain-containing protein [Candidatus Saccharibacteria bacterium]|nr:RelA/SpoT domain-containing protein [Candidatus Saccharibacteria bacterium]
MNFPPKPDYSNAQIDKAGDTIRKYGYARDQSVGARLVIDEWRIAHEYPMHTFNVTLRRKAKSIYPDAIVARRLKRLHTIIDKISNRQRRMRLSQMQDIGGVRAIMKTIRQVYQLRDIYTEPGRFPHELTAVHDYIADPQQSGYRGVHLVFRFNNSQGRQPDSRCWDGLNVEIQLRTELQHTWATGVEVVGTMRRENLKAGQGSSDWLQLFEYLASIIALLEDSPTLPQHKNMTAQLLFKRAKQLSSRLQAEARLSGWLAAMNVSTKMKRSSRYHYNILTIDPEQHLLTIQGFKKDNLAGANKLLARLEQTSPDLQPVLVAAGDITSLKRAYPNYLLDTRKLITILKYLEQTTQHPV